MRRFAFLSIGMNSFAKVKQLQRVPTSFHYSKGITAESPISITKQLKSLINVNQTKNMYIVLYLLFMFYLSKDLLFLASCMFVYGSS